MSNEIVPANERYKRTICVPRKLHDGRHKVVMKWDPNICILYAQYHNQENNTSENEARFLSVCEIPTEQNMHNPKL